MHGYKILHITVHLGGGIGTVLLNWTKRDIKNQHTILCLNRSYYRRDDDKDIHEMMSEKRFELINRIRNTDIVVVHFWNHPLLFDFLINVNIPKCRMCCWSHVSGFNAPYVFSEKLIRFSNQFVFSSPISLETKEIKKLSRKLKDKLQVIWTTGDMSQYEKIEKIPHKTFNVCFIGTLDYSKLHLNFVEMCSRIRGKIPNVKFIVCGVGCDEERIKRQVNDMNLQDCFEFEGIVKDIKPYLAIMDVFGYPLNGKHFGTCEQVLGEVMTAGIIPIVMKNPAEEYILNNYLELICNNEDEYVDNVELVYQKENNIDINIMKKNAINQYNINYMISKWNNIFKELIEQEKTKKVWPVGNEKNKKEGYSVFIESLGLYGKVLEEGSEEKIKKMFNSNSQWKSKSKGSIFQYLGSFPNDRTLLEWSKL